LFLNIRGLKNLEWHDVCRSLRLVEVLVRKVEVGVGVLELIVVEV
jgi:hypothetical protein